MSVRSLMSPLAVLCSIVLSACGGGGSGSESSEQSSNTADTVLPTSTASLAQWVSSTDGARVDARDVVRQGASAQLDAAPGSQFDIERVEEGLWHVTPRVESEHAPVALQLRVSRGDLSQTQTLSARAYSDLNGSRQVFKLEQREASTWVLGVRQSEAAVAPGAALRVHFNSNAWRWKQGDITHQQALHTAAKQVMDTKNLDNDVNTDTYILLSWISADDWGVSDDGRWVELAQLQFDQLADGAIRLTTADQSVGIQTLTLQYSKGF